MNREGIQVIIFFILKLKNIIFKKYSRNKFILYIFIFSNQIYFYSLSFELMNITRESGDTIQKRKRDS